MKAPSKADIDAAVEHGRWLASAGTIGWESRMLADLAFEVRKLRIEKKALIETLRQIANEDYRGNRPNSAILAEKTLSQIQP